MFNFWVQRYGDFCIPTIPILWHFAYQTYGIAPVLPKKAMHRALKLNRQMLQTDASQRKNKFKLSFLSYILKVYFLIHHLAVQDLEGV